MGFMEDARKASGKMAARQFGAEAYANGRACMNGEDRSNIAWYYIKVGDEPKWTDMTSEQRDEASAAFREGVDAERSIVARDGWTR